MSTLWLTLVLLGTPQVEYLRVTVLDFTEPGSAEAGVVLVVTRRPKFETMVRGRGGLALPRPLSSARTRRPDPPRAAPAAPRR